jgi:NADH-quinone oxidoreductase subunit N
MTISSEPLMAALPLLLTPLWLGGMVLALVLAVAFGLKASTTRALATGGVALALMLQVGMPAIGAAFFVDGLPLYQATPWTHVGGLVLLFLGLLAIPLLGHGLPRGTDKPELAVLAVIVLLGSWVMLGAHDLLTLYVALELSSFGLYILCASLRDDKTSSEAGLKYFILGSLASGFLLFGAALLYAQFGTTNFAGMAHGLAQAGATTGLPLLAVVGLALVLAAMAFKLSLVPFQMWTPDVYQGSPTPVTALLAAVPKVAMLVVLVRLLVGPFGQLQNFWQPALLVLVGASMAVGAVLAVIQRNLKRLLAYSTIANAGMLLCGVVAATPLGFGGALFYVGIYGLTVLGLFAVIMALKAETVNDLAGLHQRQPWLAAAAAVLLFSLAGIPLFAGFMAKLGVFLPLVQAGFVPLALIGVLASVIASFYSLWLIRQMYFAPPTNRTLVLVAPDLAVIIGLCATLSVLLGLFPSPLAQWALAAATAIF